MRPPKPCPMPEATTRPARWRQEPPLVTGRQRRASMAPIVSHRFMGIARGSASMRRRKSAAGIAKATPSADFIARTPRTRPLRPTRGPPLFPGSMGIAAWIHPLPSRVRRSATTPRATLQPRPRGFPTVIASAPGSASFELASSSAGAGAPLTSTRARSLSRSWARTEIGSSFRPSSRPIVKGRPSPMTWRFVARRPSATKNPLPTPRRSPVRPVE